MLALAALGASAAPGVAKQHQLLPEENGWSWEMNQYSGAAADRVANQKFGRALAHSGYMLRQHTCFVSDPQTMCPGAARLEFEPNRIDELRPPPNSKWLFYGPSYMEQFFGSVAAANAEDVVGYEDLQAKYNQTTYAMDLPCQPPWKQQEMMAAKAREEEQARKAEQAKREREQARELAKQNGEELPAEEEEEQEEVPYKPSIAAGCNGKVTGSECKTAPGTAIKLKNGAMIYSLNNVVLFQDEARADSMAVLEDFMLNHKFDKIFYMAVHNAGYNKEHCDSSREERSLDVARFKGGVEMCILKFHQGQERQEMKWRNDATPTTHTEYLDCVRGSPSYQIIKNHALAAGSVLQVAAPWQINPRGFKPEGGALMRTGDFYMPHAAGHKFACVAGGSTPSAPDYGDHTGLCDTGWQVGHPCSVICQADENGAASDRSKCIPGPAARMAIEMVMLSNGHPVSAEYDPDWFDFTELLMNTTSGCASCHGKDSDMSCPGCELCS